jgi:hypothetical protein
MKISRGSGPIAAVTASVGVFSIGIQGFLGWPRL